MTPPARSRRATAFLPLVLVLVAACTAQRAEGDRADSATATASGTASVPASGTASDAVPGGDSTFVLLELDRTRYAPGAPVNLRLVNRSAHAFGYNACTRMLERRDGGAWAAVPDTGRVCTMELRLLGAGETVSDRTELPRPLPAGDYRMALSLSREDASPGAPGQGANAPVRATSAPFRVE